ncbi:hypothetical protein F3K43_10960 [Streptomyces sp. LBUM 1476]|nr:hypothetical protein [Streptomyces sp. LBUM 1476]
MSSDRDGTRGGWATPGDDQPDADSGVDVTGEFTIDYAPPAWYTQNAGAGAGVPGVPPAPPMGAAVSGVPEVPGPRVPGVPGEGAYGVPGGPGFAGSGVPGVQGVSV